MKSLLCILSAIALIAAFSVPAMAFGGGENEVENSGGSNVAQDDAIAVGDIEVENEAEKGGTAAMSGDNALAVGEVECNENVANDASELEAEDLYGSAAAGAVTGDSTATNTETEDFNNTDSEVEAEDLYGSAAAGAVTGDSTATNTETEDFNNTDSEVEAEDVYGSAAAGAVTGDSTATNTETEDSNNNEAEAEKGSVAAVGGNATNTETEDSNNTENEAEAEKGSVAAVGGNATNTETEDSNNTENEAEAEKGSAAAVGGGNASVCEVDISNRIRIIKDKVELSAVNTQETGISRGGRLCIEVEAEADDVEVEKACHSGSSSDPDGRVCVRNGVSVTNVGNTTAGMMSFNADGGMFNNANCQQLIGVSISGTLSTPLVDVNGTP